MSDEDLPVCGFSGVSAEPTQIIFTEDDDDEPQVIGWVEITLRRHIENPEWAARQAFAAQALEIALAQQQAHAQAQNLELTEEQEASARDFLARTVESQHLAYCNAVPRYLVEERTGYCADPRSNKEVGEAFAAWCKTAGLEQPWEVSDGEAEED